MYTDLQDNIINQKKTIKKMGKKVVVNRCFGGFGLSDAAMESILNRKGIEFTKIPSEIIPSQFDYKTGPMEFFFDFDLERDDPDLIAVVEEMGKDSWGWASELEVVELPDDVECWEIDDYDGQETVRECGRRW